MSERAFPSDQVTIATNFLYRNYHTLAEGEVRNIDDTDGIRGDLGLKTIERATNMGVRIVACDGGSSPDFLSRLEGFRDRGFILVTSGIAGRAPQRRRAFEAATLLSNAQATAYMQPEKGSDEEGSLLDYLDEITNPILNGSADIVIPARNPELFKQTYPDYMYESEVRVNHTYNRLMQRYGLMPKDVNFDWFFGPVVFKNDPEIVALFMKQYQMEVEIRTRLGASPNPEFHSGSHYFPLIEALFQQKRVVSVEIPFEYPSTQKANEEAPASRNAFHQRRLLDASAYLTEAIHLLARLNNYPGSKIKEVN